MFVVTLTYVADLSEVDHALAEHAAWLDGHFADGVFIAAGRRLPRTGGVIIATGVNRAELDAILTEDPFSQRGLARYTVVEFEAQRVAPALKTLLPAAKPVAVAQR